MVALTYSDLGRHSKARDAAGRARDLAREDAFSLATYAYAAAGADRTEEAEKVLREVENVRGASPYLKATIHAALGRRDQALALLELAEETSRFLHSSRCNRCSGSDSRLWS